MESDTLYWKVIRAIGRTSAIATSPFVRVRYPVDEWVTPRIKGSKLLAFSRWDSADSWAQDMSRSKNVEYVVVQCYVKNPVDMIGLKLRKLDGRGVIRQVHDFWHVITKHRFKVSDTYIDALNKKGVNGVSNGVPDDTVMCDAIKCVE